MRVIFVAFSIIVFTLSLYNNGLLFLFLSSAKAQGTQPEIEKRLENALKIYMDGSMAISKGDEKKGEELYTMAYNLYLPLANQGIAEAQYKVGLMKNGGLGVNVDYHAAAEWFKKAADQGYLDAQHNLGKSYKKGLGVPQDYEMAFYWFLKSAERGDWIAQLELAELYEKGLGVSMDLVSAHMWYDVSIPLLPSAILRKEVIRIRDEMAKEMTPDQIMEAQKLSGKWLNMFQNE